jgi:hypothetical protein
MIGPVRFAIIGLLALGTSVRAQSIFLTYEQWEQLPKNLGEIYVAGVIDTLSTIAVPAQASTAKHYNECIVKSRMTLGDVAEGTKKFMEKRPDDLKRKPAPNAMVAYFITLCGLPPPSEGALPN